MPVKITSDSTCDLSPELLTRFSVTTVPLCVSLGADTYKDGVDMDVNAIYDYVGRTGELPKTSAVNIGDYIDFFRPLVADGSEVVHVCISAEFSSTYQNACIAAQEVGNVRVVDSRNLSTGQGLVVLRGAELAAEGKSAEEIAALLTELTERVEASFVIDSLDYLYKGGRCSALSAFGANLLKLKPSILVSGGKMGPEKKYRGAFGKVILQYVEDRLKDRTDIDYSRIFITHTRCDDKVVADVTEAVGKYAKFSEILETTAGATVTTHCGPNTLGILFIRTK